MSGLFIAIGHDPRSELVKGQVHLDADGYVITDGRSTKTNLPGVFALGIWLTARTGKLLQPPAPAARPPLTRSGT